MFTSVITNINNNTNLKVYCLLIMISYKLKIDFHRLEDIIEERFVKDLKLKSTLIYILSPYLHSLYKIKQTNLHINQCCPSFISRNFNSFLFICIINYEVFLFLCVCTSFWRFSDLRNSLYQLYPIICIRRSVKLKEYSEFSFCTNVNIYKVCHK